jgi:hypothetical protein
MAHPTYLDSTGATRSRKGTGAGTDGSPDVLHNNIDLIAAGTNLIGKVSIDQVTAGANVTADGGWGGPALAQTYTYSADMTTAAALTAAPTGGQKIKATDILVSVANAGFVTVQMETSTNVLAGVFLPANGTYNFCLRGMIKGDAADKKLYGKSTTAGGIAWTIKYHSEA